MYHSSDRIVTWSIRRLCSLICSSTSRFRIADPTNIRWVTVENRRISHKIWHYFTAIQRILVESQIWKREVKEQATLHNIHIDHVMIQSEPKNLFAAKVQPRCRNREMEPHSGSNPAKDLGDYVRFGSLGGSWARPGPWVCLQPGTVATLVSLPPSCCSQSLWRNGFPPKIANMTPLGGLFGSQQWPDDNL